jgi:hypothetical protein
LHPSHTSPLQREGSTARKGGAGEEAPPGEESGAVSGGGRKLEVEVASGTEEAKCRSCVDSSLAELHV